MWSAPSQPPRSPELKRLYFSATKQAPLGGVPTVTDTPVGFNQSDPSTARKVLLYLHGGGYVNGACRKQWVTVAVAARALRVPVVCADYRLAPEHPFPAALDDATAVYKALLARGGGGGADIAILGDSAGGGLALALLQRLRAEGLPYPAALALYSPWSELTKSGDTQTTLEGVDPRLSYARRLGSAALAYVGGDAAWLSDPRVSPLRANWSARAVGRLPRILIQVGLRDSLLSNAAQLYRKLRAGGQEAEFSPWEGMWHDWQTWTE